MYSQEVDACLVAIDGIKGQSDMIQCTKCSSWLHRLCAGIRMSAFDSDDSFFAWCTIGDENHDDDEVVTWPKATKRPKLDKD